MKQIITIICLIFIYSITNAQINECKKIVGLTVEAINEHSSAKIKNYLADDFTIAGMDGAMAKMVLDKLISQLNETVIDVKKTGEDENEFITLTYEIEYSRLGKKNAFFIFNKQNQLKELSLFKMEVKTMSGKSNIEKNTDSVTVVPFKKLGKLILVEANLNGVKKSFLLDNGAPKLVLNSKYSSSEIKAEKTLSSAQSVNGSISGMNIEKVKDLIFMELKWKTKMYLQWNYLTLKKN